MDPTLLALLLSSLGNQSNSFLGGGQQQNLMSGGTGPSVLDQLLQVLLGSGLNFNDQSLGGSSMNADNSSPLYQALFGTSQPAGYQQTFYNPNAQPMPAQQPYGGTGVPSLAPGQSYTTPGQQVYTAPGPNAGPLLSQLYNYSNAAFTPMGGQGLGQIAGYGYGLDPTTGGRGQPVLTGYVGERHKTDPVPVGTKLPSAWGDITYMGGGMYSQAANVPQWIRDLDQGLGYAQSHAGVGGGGGAAPGGGYQIDPTTPPLTYTGAPGQYTGQARYNWDPNTPPLTYTGAPSGYVPNRYGR